MKRYLFILLTLAIFAAGCSNKRKGSPRILVFTKTSGFHHSSIPDGVKAIQKMGKKHHFDVDTTTNAAWFTEDSLKQYSAVVFLNTTGNVLNMRQQKDFKRYIQAGGGYVGVHAASDCEYHWPWYGKLVGAYFTSHPHQQKAKLIIHKDENFPVTDSLPNPWIRKDEWYNFKSPPKDVNILVSIDEKSYEGGTNGDNHPMVWYHDFDGGRSFYMELGHTSESYTEPAFLHLLWAGIDYAIGKNELPDYSKVTALRVPDENRFSKKILGGGLNEPTELTVLPDLSVLIAERKGGIMYYNSQTQKIKQVAHLEVYHHTLHTEGVNVEMGLMGLQASPHYSKNHWVYVYYSPVDTSVDRLSRFKFQNGQFDVQSEQVILEVHTKREICCHTGGSIAFDADDNLYLSVGDNTTPFDEVNPKTGKAYPINTHGFAPLDDRPGFEHYDDRRAAGNSNDLRGKILRIHVNEDGSYSIPKGNLFPEGTPKTRPEIYVMGDRNPYRISVDKHTGYLYWGEVGPDASHDSLKTRGPKGYDEVNQAKEAGNFGWPYFVGDNYAYHQYNYATGVSGPTFDPNHLVNDSRNNTGVRVLPPAQPAFIWYPYDKSERFPIIGDGGRTAMAGPVYYVDDYPDSTDFPAYYNGKLFIYDFMRNWIMVVTMDKQGDLLTIEPFMPHTTFHSMIDMEAGPDGRLYIVEYGEGWFTKNPDAALSVISYNGGNRPPMANIQASVMSGSLPLKVELSAKGSKDPDNDSLRYKWHFGNGKQTATDNPVVTHTFEKAGVYPVCVTLTDQKGGKATSRKLQIYAGNSIPKVDIKTIGNSTFYFPDKPVRYDVKIKDREDKKIDADQVFVDVQYLTSPDKAALIGHQRISIPQGKSLMEALDCKTCHKIAGESIGPAFKKVAMRYKNDHPKALKFLSHKIINGGSGNWGETAMAAHPGLAKSDAKKIVSWILSLSSDTSKANKSMPMNGRFVPADKFQLQKNGYVVLSASYTDHGSSGVPALTGSKDLILRSPILQAADAEVSSGVSAISYEGKSLKVVNKNGWLMFPNISLNDITNIRITYGVQKALKDGWSVEIHQDKPGGKLLGKTVFGQNAEAMKMMQSTVSVSDTADSELHDVYFVFHKVNDQEQGVIGVSSFIMAVNND